MLNVIYLISRLHQRVIIAGMKCIRNALISFLFTIMYCRRPANDCGYDSQSNPHETLTYSSSISPRYLPVSLNKPLMPPSPIVLAGLPVIRVQLSVSSSRRSDEFLGQLSRWKQCWEPHTQRRLMPCGWKGCMRGLLHAETQLRLNV